MTLRWRSFFWVFDTIQTNHVGILQPKFFPLELLFPDIIAEQKVSIVFASIMRENLIWMAVRFGQEIRN